jgi:uncharacterized protein
MMHSSSGPETPLAKLNILYRERMQMGIAWLMKTLRRDRFRTHDFVLDTLDVTVPGLGVPFDGYTIIHITDIHMGHWISPHRLEGVVEIINQQSPDVVVITGDFVSYVFSSLRASLVNSLSTIQATDGKFAVLGNHDHWLGAHHVRSALQESDVHELANDFATIRKGSALLHICGVDDVMVKADRLDDLMEKLPPDGPALLLAHEPDFADQSAATGRFFLQLSGHSHGGQIVWPGLGPLVRGPMFAKYPLGLYNVQGMLQYTNRGIGTHVFRVRINCPPEITRIILHAAPA